MERKQNSTPKAIIDDNANVVKEYYSVDAYYISSVKLATSVSLGVVETEDLIKYVYNNSVITCPSTHTNVELFPWDNMQQYIFKISKQDYSDARYFDLNGIEISISVGEETAPTENLTTGGAKVAKVYAVEATVYGQTSYKRIYVFDRKITQTYDGDGASSTVDLAFSVISSDISTSFGSATVQAAYTSDGANYPMYITFGSWSEGVSKTFDILTGNEKIS